MDEPQRHPSSCLVGGKPGNVIDGTGGIVGGWPPSSTAGRGPSRARLTWRHRESEQPPEAI